MAELDEQRERIDARIHIVEGLVAMLEREDLHASLRACATVREATELLMGPDFGLSEIQARHTLDASNRRYIRSARTELHAELDELRRQAADLDGTAPGEPED